MRARTLIAIGGLTLAGTGLALPANAVDPEIITRTAAEAADVCVGNAGATFHVTSCYNRAPGNQYRAGVNCTNTSWIWGPWRNQTSDLSNKSRVDCPGTGRANNWAIQFRTV
jgi:hypothetical protein